MYQIAATSTTAYPFKWYSVASSTGSGAQFATTTEYIFNNDSLVSTVDQQFVSGVATGSPATRYIHPDHLGSTNVVTDQDGAVVQTLDYYPFGTTRVSSGVNATSRKFIGQFADESNLSYLQARYYDPSRGQFLSQDPSFLAVGDPTQLKQITGLDQQTFLADPQLANSTSYARDNPITIKDPNGNIGYVAGFLIAGEVYGAAQLYYDNYMVLRSTTWDRGSFTDAQRSQIQGKAYYDALLEGSGLGAVAFAARGVKGMTALANSLNVLGVAQDALDYGWGEQIYSAYNNQRGAQNGSGSVPALLLNTGRPINGFNITNIFSNSMQARIDTAKTYNASSDSSGSGGRSPSSNTLWVTPSGAVVTFGGQLVAPPPISTNKK